MFALKRFGVTARALPPVRYRVGFGQSDEMSDLVQLGHVSAGNESGYEVAKVGYVRGTQDGGW